MWRAKSFQVGHTTLDAHRWQKRRHGQYQRCNPWLKMRAKRLAEEVEQREHHDARRVGSPCVSLPLHLSSQVSGRACVDMELFVATGNHAVHGGTHTHTVSRTMRHTSKLATRMQYTTVMPVPSCVCASTSLAKQTQAIGVATFHGRSQPKTICSLSAWPRSMGAQSVRNGRVAQVAPHPVAWTPGSRTAHLLGRTSITSEDETPCAQNRKRESRGSKVTAQGTTRRLPPRYRSAPPVFWPHHEDDRKPGFPTASTKALPTIGTDGPCGVWPKVRDGRPTGRPSPPCVPRTANE